MAARHINADSLEIYALGRLAESDGVPVEEHLLVCEQCRERLAGWDEYVGAMRSACWQFRAVPLVRGRWRSLARLIYPEGSQRESRLHALGRASADVACRAENNRIKE